MGEGGGNTESVAVQRGREEWALIEFCSCLTEIM